MTFLTFCAADIFDGNGIFIAGPEIAEKPVIDGIEFVPMCAIGSFGEIHLCRTVTVDTPAHAEIGKLFYLIHFLNRTMTGLTLHLADAHVL